MHCGYWVIALSNISLFVVVIVGGGGSGGGGGGVC